MAANNTVLLGDIVFQRREVPDHMPWGGEQKLAIHTLLGGTRVIDAMGPNPHPIQWSGLFFGTAATDRARRVDAMKDQGGQVSLHWGSFSYQVVIHKFLPVYKHEWEVHYEISCEVVTQSTSGATNTLDTSINNDLNTVIAL